MKALRFSLLVALSIAFIAPVHADESAAAKKDLATLQGEWRMTAGTADGMDIPDGMRANSRRICKGDELTAIVGGQLVMKAKITLAAEKKPKAIDYDVTDGPNKGRKLLGIYELDGDTFKACYAAPGRERPKDFTSQSGEKVSLTVWKRVTSSEKPVAK